MNIRPWRAVQTLALMSALALSACGGETPATAVSVPARAAPATPAILNTFEHACRNCHSVAASGAPQVGDAKAWAPRLAQGREILLDHSINGYKAMPPMGTCTACSEQDFAALIEYMSGARLK